MEPPAIVYRFLDEDGRLLYVGVTIVGPRRWGEHAVIQPWWRLVSTVKVAHYDTYSEACAAEHRAIATEDPLYNITFRASGKVRRPPARKRKPGTGSVFQNADGRWVAQMSSGPRGGRRMYRKNVATKELAEAALREMLQRVAAGQIPRERQRPPRNAQPPLGLAG